MKHLFACLALCASLSASAQGDNCTVLGIQDLTQMVFELQGEIDSLKGAGMTRDSVADIAVGVAWRLDELAGANLTGADFSSHDLSFVNFGPSELPDPGTYFTNLTDADLSGANLHYARFDYANLSDADLSGAYLDGANLSNANLSGANLSGADLNGAIFYDVDFTGANLTGASLETSVSSMNCLFGCPSQLPSDYICEPDPNCSEPNRYRIDWD